MIRRLVGIFIALISVSGTSVPTRPSFTNKDTETMQWSHPDTVGDIPPPSRAHTATLVDRKIFIFGGGQSANYSDTVYVLDTTTRRWTRPEILGEIPAPRRAHTAVYYKEKIWVFGGGNGMMALNDVWALHVGRMEWEKVRPRGMVDRFGREVLPTPRGYHTANLVGNMMIVVGGSDGKDCFAEVWLLNLGEFLSILRFILLNHFQYRYSRMDVDGTPRVT